MSKENPKLGHRHGVPSNLEKDPDDWITGAERMTDAQASYLKTLCEEAKEEFDPTLTKAEASKRIEALQLVTGRGQVEEEAEGEGDAPARDSQSRSVPREDFNPDDLD